MRKKVLCMLLSTVICFGMCSCGNAEQKENTSGNVENHYFVDGKELSEDEYNQYLEDKENLEAELTEAEKAAIYTIQQLQNALKNPHSMKIYSIAYKRQYSSGTGNYIFKVEYSAENNIGGTVEDTLYYQFDTGIYLGDTDSERALSAQMFGCKEVAFNEYDTGKRADFEEQKIDIDRVLNNLDIDILANTKE